MRKIGFMLGTASVALVLVSCSGGGGGSTPTPVPTPTIASFAAGTTTSSDRQIAYETHAPTITSFTATPLVVPFGQPTVFSWTLGGGAPTQFTINNGISVLGQASYTDILPLARRLAYYLTASNPNGSTGDVFTRVIGQGMEAYAGSVLGGWGAEDGTGGAARTYYPDGMACDAQGNVYLTDEGMNTIRKIAPGGVVTTLLGSAITQKSSSTGSFANAGLGFPTGMTWWPDGDLLITTDHGVMIITAPNWN